MSSIPSSAMPHAKAPHDEPAKPAASDKTATDWIDEATDAAKAGFATASEAVKANPKTALAVGAAVLAGLAAAVAGPALLHKEPAKKPAAKRKPAAKKAQPTSRA